MEINLYMETSAVLKTILNIFITACRNIEVYEEEEKKNSYRKGDGCIKIDMNSDIKMTKITLIENFRDFNQIKELQ